MGCEIADINGVELPNLRQMREQGQLLRGDFLDAFGRLENAVMQYIGKTDVKAAPGVSFAQKLTALAKARDRFRNPKRLDVRINAIRELLPVRADIVHSALEVIVVFDGRSMTSKLQFQNAADAGRPPLVLAGDELNILIRKLNQLAAQFSHQRLKEAAPARSADLCRPGQ